VWQPGTATSSHRLGHHGLDRYTGAGQDADDPSAAPDPFRASSQVGVVGTLHHVSAIRDSDARRSVIGLTYRIGRHIPGEL